MLWIQVLSIKYKATSKNVISVKTGIYTQLKLLDSRFRGSDRLGIISRLLKNTRLLRCAHPSSLRRTVKYDSFLTISRALHLDVFDQPGEKLLFQQPVRGSHKNNIGEYKWEEIFNSSR